MFIAILIAGCSYNDFETDFDYSTVYFANQKLKRTFVEGEINEIKVGIVLGGKRVNSVDEKVVYTLQDTTGFSATSYKLLPENYYTLSSYDEFNIPSGEFSGEISMTIDPAFFQDSLSTEEEYAILFKLTDATTDSIHSGKDSLLLVLDFEHHLFGNYYHNGQVIVMDSLTGEPMDTIIYHQEEPVTSLVNNWFLGTIASSTMQSRGIGQYAPSDLSGFILSVKNDNSIGLSDNPDLIASGYEWNIEAADGSNNRYDSTKKEFYLNYKFTDVLSGNECHATDTLTFRNRILDGVNQWDF